MLKPFYQGKLDTFCAIYAVLNAFRLLYGMKVSKARDILNTTLLSYCSRPARFMEILTMETDYIELVDEILITQKRLLPLEVIQPYRAGDPKPSVDDLWNLCADWLAGQKEINRGRAMVFRFLRHFNAESGPVNRHWTTANYVDGDILHLFDCSHEAEAILNIRKNSFVTSPDDLDKEHLLYIQPDSVRLLRQSF